MILNSRGLLGAGLGKSSSRQPAAAAGVALPPGSPLHWFDFADTSTLFQDTGTATPATSNGDLIGHVQNKGSDGTGLIQATSDERMALDLLFDTGVPSAQSPGGGDTGTLSSAITTGISTSLTFCVVFAPDNTTTAELIFSYPEAVTPTGIGMRQVGTATHTIMVQSLLAHRDPYTAGLWIAGIGVNRTANEQEMWHSIASGSQTGAATHAAIADAARMNIGASSEPGAFDFTGNVGEVIVWDSDLTASVADIKTYVTTKYGLAWA